MKIRIYNENGIVRITKVTQAGIEYSMFSNLHDGEIAEINLEATLSYSAHKSNCEAEWKYWDGWCGNHDKRIEGATCSKCGYEHHTVKGSPEKLSDYCPSCKSKMKKF